MSGHVLDASALLALLLNETGADAVTEVLHEASMCAVNVAEVVSYFANLGASHDNIKALLQPLPIMIFPADAELSYAAGMLRYVTRHAGLSLGDRYCLAFAANRGDRVITADRSWARIADEVGISVKLIR